MNKLLIILFAVFTLLFGYISAHEDHKHKEKADTVTVVNGDTVAINGIPVGKLSAEKSSEDSLKSQTKEKFEIEYTSSAFEHIHNKVVHFPIAFILAAFLFSIISLKSNKYELVLKVLVSLSAIFAIAAFITGSEQLIPFQNSPKEWIANLHRVLGISTIVVNLIWLLFLNIKSLKRYAIFISLLASILVIAAGFYGGIISH